MPFEIRSFDSHQGQQLSALLGKLLQITWNQFVIR